MATHNTNMFGFGAMGQHAVGESDASFTPSSTTGTAPRYRPPTRVVSRDVPLLALICQADPDFQRRKHHEVEYEFSNGRRYFGDPEQRGLYNRRSNSYAVGQPYGDLDALVEAGLTTTAGNEVPGLYKGIPTAAWD